MEKKDLEMEQRVWQRVKGGPDLRGMELRCRESAAAFRQLAASASGENRDTLLRLHGQEHANAERLLGMRILSGEEPEPKRKYDAVPTPLLRGLAQAVHRSRQALADYSGQTGEYAPVFAVMAREEAARMGELLGLIGRLR